MNSWNYGIDIFPDLLRLRSVWVHTPLQRVAVVMGVRLLILAIPFWVLAYLPIHLTGPTYCGRAFTSTLGFSFYILIYFNCLSWVLHFVFALDSIHAAVVLLLV